MDGSNIPMGLRMDAVDDGRNVWVSITVQCGPLSLTFGVPEGNFSEFKRQFYDNFGAVSQEAKKLKQKRGVQLSVPTIQELETIGTQGHTCQTDPGLPCLGCAVVSAAQVKD